MKCARPSHLQKSTMHDLIKSELNCQKEKELETEERIKEIINNIITLDKNTIKIILSHNYIKIIIYFKLSQSMSICVEN